jgi:hypothetical protein
VQGWSQPVVLLSLIGGILALFAFVVVEARTAEPMVPLRLFRSRAFSGTNLLTLFLYAGLALVPTFLPLDQIVMQGYPEELAGLTLLPLALSLFLLSRFTGGMTQRVGARVMLTVGPAIAGLGMFWLGLPGVTSGAGEYWTTFFPGALLLGVGMGITVAPLTTTVMGSAPSEMSGTASGINNAVSRTAGVLAIAIFTAIALTFFGDAIQSRTGAMDLSGEVRTELRVEAARLAEARVPDSAPAALQPVIQQGIQLAFVDTFRLIAWGAAGLAWLGALCAWATLRK